jgi:probable HAF family extracellular repeat protein
MTNLGTLGGADSAAYGINDAGQIVGSSGILGGPVTHAFFRSTDGTMTDLGVLAGYTSSAQAINNALQIVGASTSSAGPSHAFLTQVANCSESITVTSSADSGAGSLRQAMNDVCYGGTITFASNLSGATIALSSTLTPDKPQTIDGSSLAAHVILSGDSNGDGTGDVQVFSINPGVAVTLKALTITKGQATNYGGGLHNQGTLTVTDSLFSYNTATWYGGGIDNVGTLTVTASVFSNNTATFGGGLYNESAGVVTIAGSTFLTNTASTSGGGLFNNQQLTVTNSVFSFNEAPVGGGLHNVGALAVTDSTFSHNAANGYGGGGIDNQGGALTVTNSHFVTNTAQWGGGLYNDPSGTATVTDSAFTTNDASSQGGGLVNHGTLTVTHALFERNTSAWGGGLGNTGNLTALTASTFISNTANDSGGGLANSGRLTVMNSTFSGNTATQRGGGLYNNGATATVTASTLSGNRTTHTPYGNGYGGGGIYNGGTLTVQTSTLGDNSAPFNTGGGIYNNSVLTVQASTLSGNSADYGSGLWNETGYTSLIQTIIANSSAGHDCGLASGNVTSVDSLIEGDACGVSSDYNTLLGIDPLLGPLADNGGSTQTFALLPGSPAIDVVKLNPCLATDQRGEARDDLRCDMGAYELKYPDSPTVIRSVSSTITTTFGPALIGIQRNAGATDPGVITVTKSLTWKTKPANAIDAYWLITPTIDSGFNLTLMLCYTPAENNGLDLNALRFWQYSGGTWNAVGDVPSTSTVGTNTCATISGVTELSTWTLATDVPTAITLNDLSARASSDAASALVFVLLSMVLVIGGGAWFKWQTRQR